MFAYPIMGQTALEKEYFLMSRPSDDTLFYGYYDLVAGEETVLAQMEITNFNEPACFAGDGSRFLVTEVGCISSVYTYNSSTPNTPTLEDSYDHGAQALSSIVADESNPGFYVTGPPDTSSTDLDYCKYDLASPYTISLVERATTGAWMGRVLDFKNSSNEFVPMIYTTPQSGSKIYPITSLDGDSGITINTTNGVTVTFGTGNEYYAQEYHAIGGKYYFTLLHTSNNTINIYEYDPVAETISVLWTGANPGAGSGVAMTNGYLVLQQSGSNLLETYSYSAAGLVKVDDVAYSLTDSYALNVGKHSGLVYRPAGSAGRAYEVASDGTITEHGTFNPAGLSQGFSIKQQWDTSKIGLS